MADRPFQKGCPGRVQFNTLGIKKTTSHDFYSDRDLFIFTGIPFNCVIDTIAMSQYIKSKL